MTHRSKACTNFNAHLGSKRGVTRGVEPIPEEESNMPLAGVIKGFLHDLNPDKTKRIFTRLEEKIDYK